MPSPQLISAAPSKDCPKCGARMQLVTMNPSTYLYACYKHVEGAFYLNVHHSFKTNPDGSILEGPSVVRPRR